MVTYLTWNHAFRKCVNLSIILQPFHHSCCGNHLVNNHKKNKIMVKNASLTYHIDIMLGTRNQEKNYILNRIIQKELFLALLKTNLNVKKMQ